MESYRERLWPAPWIALIAALAIPASMLTFAPINLLVGVVVGVVLAAGVVAAAAGTAPILEVSGGTLRAGAARVPVTLVGTTTTYRGEDARWAKGRDLDARAFLVLRPDIIPALLITLTDADDPAPYWLVSTRRPEQLAEAIAAAQLRGKPHSTEQRS